MHRNWPLSSQSLRHLLAFSSDGPLLAAAGNGSIAIWDTESYEARRPAFANTESAEDFYLRMYRHRPEMAAADRCNRFSSQVVIYTIGNHALFFIFRGTMLIPAVALLVPRFFLCPCRLEAHHIGRTTVAWAVSGGELASTERHRHTGPRLSGVRDPRPHCDGI